MRQRGDSSTVAAIALLLAPILILSVIPIQVIVGLALATVAFRIARSAYRRYDAQLNAAAPIPPPAGVLIGHDVKTNEPVVLSDEQLAAHGLIVGASGSGKTTSLLSILVGEIQQGHTVIAIDLKGSPAFASTLEAAAHSAGRAYDLWTPDGPGHWNPLAIGNPTELKDKLISTESWSEIHYQRAAERYWTSPGSVDTRG